MDDIYTTPRHTPPHWFVPNAIYMVTGATLYQKPWLDSAEKKRHFCETLMERSSLLSWAIEAWAVMSNHYHFVARAPEDATTLKALVQGIHSISAKFVNKLDRASGRRIWYNYWDSARFRKAKGVVTAPLQIMQWTVAGYKRSSPGRAGRNVSRQ
ncbi:MAG: hypothetical protein EHM81_10335 [Chloroflexi bacterium]|nr:MAG: hypothetical protein EHM81_10335 [Chloroflexota bacterium]